MAASISSQPLDGAPESRRDLYAPKSEPSFDNADTIVMRRSGVIPTARPRPMVWSAPESAPALAPRSRRPEAPASAQPVVSDAVPSSAPPRRGGLAGAAAKLLAGAAGAAILAGAGAWAGTYAFFLLDRTWVAPTILTPGDPRVVALASRYVEASAARDALILQRGDIELRVREAERRVVVEQAFQVAAIAAKEAMASPSEPASAEVAPAAADSEERVGRDAVASPRAALREPTAYELAKIAADHERSAAAAQKASEEIDSATRALAALDKTIQDQERVLAAMRRSPYYGISSGRAVFAFVPYGNASGATEGAPVHACRAGIAWCRTVGHLGSAAEGEVVQRHPWLDKDVRGTLVRVELEDGAAAESGVLHVGRRPLSL